jgi:hypothetical protein
MTAGTLPLSYVYIVVATEGGLARVGTSVDPDARCRATARRAGRQFEVAWKHPGDEVLEGFVQHVLAHRRVENDWFDFEGLGDVRSIGGAVVVLWKALGMPEQYRSAHIRCAKYPLAGEPFSETCMAIPRFRNRSVRTS